MKFGAALDQDEVDAARAAARKGSVSDIPDAELLGRAVKASRASASGGYHPRWACVMESFSMGSTYARDLCRRYNVDPDELVRRQ